MILTVVSLGLIGRQPSKQSCTSGDLLWKKMESATQSKSMPGYPRLLSCIRDLRRQVDREVEVERIALVGLSSLPQEMLLGKRRQLRRITKICNVLDTAKANIVSSGISAANLFDVLRDCYSLNPGNKLFLDAFRALALDLSGESVDCLKNILADKYIVAHVSCEKRLEAAQESVASFEPASSKELHLVVSGNSLTTKFSQSSPGFSLVDHRLILDAPDNYEGHCTKVMLLYTLLYLFGPPKGCLKLDDDIHLLSRYRLDRLLEELEADRIDYAGYTLNPTNSTFFHGWHIGKCQGKQFHNFGHQYPLPQIYAKGGDGYFLSAKALAALGESFLSKRAFYAAFPMLEDIIVGLTAQLAGIPLAKKDFLGERSTVGDKPIFYLVGDSACDYDQIRRMNRSTLRHRSQEYGIFRSRVANLLKRR